MATILARRRNCAELPLLKGEGGGEVCDLSEESTHLTLSLSFQERGPAPTSAAVSSLVAEAA
jgi:hypothetical protein